MTTTTDDDRAIAIARKSVAQGYRRVTPYRLGIAVGYLGFLIRNPYADGRGKAGRELHGRRHFDEGVAVGRAAREREKEL